MSMFADIAQEALLNDLIKYFKEVKNETIEVKEVISVLKKFKKDIG